ncbi:MAG: DUF2845 domain-containing protein, partial [Myxococcota bacterium]
HHPSSGSQVEHGLGAAGIFGEVERSQGCDLSYLPPPVRQRVTQRETIEVWTYRGDGRSLARAITVRRGKVAKIATLGPLDLPKDPGCAKSMFDLGTRTGVVRLSCGAPVDRSSWEEEVELEINGALVGQVRVHERWTYSPGKGRFLRILNFVDGKLVSVKTGPRIN